MVGLNTPLMPSFGCAGWEGYPFSWNSGMGDSKSLNSESSAENRRMRPDHMLEMAELEAEEMVDVKVGRLGGRETTGGGGESGEISRRLSEWLIEI